MPSLFLRIFLGFWLVIGALLAAGVLLSYQVAEQRREAWEQFDPRAVHFEASDVVSRGGRDALTRWLREGAGLPEELTLYVVDETGRDLLERPLPRRLMAEFAHRHRMFQRDRSLRSLPPNFRPARPAPQLVGPDGRVYTMLLTRTPRGAIRLLPDMSVRMTLLVFALLVSALVAWLLARTLSRPVEALKRATRALADGDLDARVSGGLAERRDELGQLSRDFNDMASRLEASQRSQKELLRNISHELRSPLARLRVALGLAQRDVGDHASLTRIEKEAERLDWLIGEILDFARADAGAPRTEVFDLTTLVRELVRDARFECGTEGPRIEFPADASVRVKGQRDALASAIENILRNAAHHAGRRVSLCLQRSAGGLTLSIADDGGGVPEEELALLFEPFYRGDKVGTAGLGLAIARRVTELHDGSIEARNLPDGGLEVRLHLPSEMLMP